MHSPAGKSVFALNNFDLIRLFAAAQVAHYHVFFIMGVEIADWHWAIIRFLSLFPGVPVFFFISGFLISKSWEKSSGLHHYAINRILRIYPALILAVSLSFLLIHISGYVAQVRPGLGELVLLFLAKASFVQFYNPDFMRAYGDGVMNGSLWTITVELQFYCLAPLLYWVLKRCFRISTNTVLLILIGLFLCINMVFHQLHAQWHDQVLYKLVGVSFAPWFYMFLLGVWFQRNFDFFHRLLAGRFLLCLALYIPLAILARYLGAGFGNAVNPIVFALLAILVFSAAYSHIDLSNKVLRGTDISYGVYIYHMPFVNYLLYTGYFSGYAAGLAAAAATLLMAILSWFLVERNALKLKPKTIRKVQ